MTGEEYNAELASDVGGDLGLGYENYHSREGSTGSSIVEIGHQSEMIDNNDDDIVNLELEDHQDMDEQEEDQEDIEEMDDGSGEEEEDIEQSREEQEDEEEMQEEHEEQSDEEHEQDGPMAEDLDQQESSNSESVEPEDYHTVDPIAIEPMDSENVEFVVPDATAVSSLVDVKPVEPEQLQPIEIAEVDPIQEDADMDIEAERLDAPNTSTLQFPSSSNNFTTPSKALPALKDIDYIETPKSFSVARDGNDDNQIQSSPLVQNILPSIQVDDANNSQTDISVIHENKENNSLSIVSKFLGISEIQVASLSSIILDSLLKKSLEFTELQANVSFLKINQERLSQISDNKLKSISSKLKDEESKMERIESEKDSLRDKLDANEQKLTDYSEKINELNNKVTSLNQTIVNLEKSLNSQSYERETIQYHNQINLLTKDNIDKNQRINELTKEISDVKNEFFAVKLDLTKSSNEASHFKRQKQWFENELKSCQDRFTELSKTYQSERLTKDNEITELSAKVMALTSTNKSLNESIRAMNIKQESQMSQIHKLDQTVEASKIRFERELKQKEEIIEILRIQIKESTDRISELDAHIETIQSKSSEAMGEIEQSLQSRTEKCMELEEKLRRTEEALEKELREENDLPQLTHSAELIASHSNGISLSSLYSEYNHLKKQLILERSQKEKLANELQTFVNELESKKPVILSYKEQISFYEVSMRDMVAKIESIRFEKLESDKKVLRLKNKVMEYEDELVSMKKLCKDLGKQLCYYLIHSKIHDSNENPLSLAEKQAIDNILERTGNNESVKESDIDKLISERLVGFANIVELQQKNSELLTITRELGKKLEDQDSKSNNELESVAIEEAKDAILTLEGELDSLRTKHDAVSKERDVLKSLSSSSVSSESNSGNVKYLADMNNDLKKRVEDYEASIKSLQSESSSKLKEMSKKLETAQSERDEFKLKVNSMNHQVELIQHRFENSKSSLETTKAELNRLQEAVDFWKKQASKQENLLVNKNNELKDLESKLSKQSVEINSTKHENQLLTSIQKKTQEDIEQLKNDKAQLNEFVANLQSLLKEREAANSSISERLAQSISNYQYLQDKLAERDEKLSVLSNQSELALKAQNTKLEQVNELSYTLMNTKNLLTEKTRLVESLNNRVNELTDSLKKSDTHIKALQMNNGTGTTSTGANHDLIELEQAKHELQVAETQAKEYQALAKSAEDTLVNVTDSFEEYKKENDTIQAALKQEKDSLSKEVEKLDGEIRILQQELADKDSKYADQMNELKLQLDESLIKAKYFDNLQAEFDSRVENNKQELEMYAKMAEENQKKYNDELIKNETTSREVLSLKEINEGLSNTIDSLKSEVESLNDKLLGASAVVDDEKQKIEEELSSEKSKVKDLESQNGILLNQLELLKVPPQSDDAGESIVELRQVISYIRREKESVEAKLSVLADEKQQLEARFNSAISELNIVKTELGNSKTTINIDDSNKQHDKILEQLEQINILRESNTTLRNENENYARQLQRIQVQVKANDSKANPLSEQIKKLNELIEEKEQSIKLLKEENDRLSTAAQNLGGSNEDSEKLQALQTRFNNLLNESRTKLGAARNKEKEYQKVVDQLGGDVQKAQEDLAKAKEQHEKELAKVKEQFEKELKAKEQSKEKGPNKGKEINKIRQEAQNAAKSEIEKAKQQFDNEKSKLVSEYEAKIKDALNKSKNNEWKSKFDELEKSFDANKSNLEAEFNQKLKEEIKKVEDSKQDNSSVQEYETKIANLQKEFSEKLEKEKQEVRAQTEKKFELKLKMLNKKIERLDAKSPAPSSPAQATQTTPSTGFGSSSLNSAQSNGNDKKRGFTAEEEDSSNKKPKE